MQPRHTVISDDSLEVVEAIALLLDVAATHAGLQVLLALVPTPDRLTDHPSITHKYKLQMQYTTNMVALVKSPAPSLEQISVHEKPACFFATLWVLYIWSNFLRVTACGKSTVLQIGRAHV